MGHGYPNCSLVYGMRGIQLTRSRFEAIKLPQTVIWNNEQMASLFVRARPVRLTWVMYVQSPKLFTILVCIKISFILILHRHQWVGCAEMLTCNGWDAQSCWTAIHHSVTVISAKTKAVRRFICCKSCLVVAASWSIYVVRVQGSRAKPHIFIYKRFHSLCHKICVGTDAPTGGL